MIPTSIELNVLFQVDMGVLVRQNVPARLRLRLSFVFERIAIEQRCCKVFSAHLSAA